MTLVVGLPRDGRAKAALHLATMLARSGGEDLVVCAVAPAPWPAGMAKIDAEYQEYLVRCAKQGLDMARQVLPAGLPAGFEVSRARSVPSGLLAVAEKYHASMLVLGSSSSGALGRVALGAASDQLLHSSPVPVALATRGFRARPDATVRRVTAAYSPAHSPDEPSSPALDLLLAAAEVAARVGATLRLASFAVRPAPVLTAGIGSHAEDSVLAQWDREIEQAQQAVLARIATLPTHPVTETAIGHGPDWVDALEDIGWADGDVLLVGSSTVGPLSGVFLGSRASKIVRNSPVPVVVVPRRAQPEPVAGRPRRWRVA